MTDMIKGHTAGRDSNGRINVVCPYLDGEFPLVTYAGRTTCSGCDENLTGISPDEPLTCRLPLLVNPDDLLRGWRVYGQAEIPFDAFPAQASGGPALVAISNGCLSSTCHVYRMRTGASRTDQACDNGLITVEVVALNGDDEPAHPLHGATYSSHAAADRAMYAAGLLGFMVYERDRTALGIGYRYNDHASDVEDGCCYSRQQITCIIPDAPGQPASRRCPAGCSASDVEAYIAAPVPDFFAAPPALADEAPSAAQAPAGVWTADTAAAYVAELDDADRDLLADALLQAKMQTDTRALVDVVREALDKEGVRCADVTGVVFTATDYPDGCFLTEDAAVYLVGGELLGPLTVSGSDDIMTRLFGKVGPDGYALVNPSTRRVVCEDEGASRLTQTGISTLVG